MTPYRLPFIHGQTRSRILNENYDIQTTRLEWRLAYRNEWWFRQCTTLFQAVLGIYFWCIVFIAWHKGRWSPHPGAPALHSPSYITSPKRGWLPAPVYRHVIYLAIHHVTKRGWLPAPVCRHVIYLAINRMTKIGWWPAPVYRHFIYLAIHHITKRGWLPAPVYRNFIYIAIHHMA